MINRLYHNEPASVNQPRPWPWKDHPPRSFGRRRKDNRRGGSAQPPRRVVLDGSSRSEAPSELTRVRRLPERARYDRATLEAILDEALVCHLSTVLDGTPIVIPTMFARIDDRLYVHGSTGSRMMRALSKGALACVEVTLLDGLVLARSALHHSMNYRSVIAYGSFEQVQDAEKLRAMEALIERVAPGRWDDVRPPSPKELARTTILSLPLTEASAKVRSGMPIDDPADLELPVWAGVIPLVTERGTPIPDLEFSEAGAPAR
ncbi:MAG: pyridoxamine 5'-phosphate oxidase family protein [Actinomycetota bacterium]